jgi:hypothetical protein
MLWDRQRVEAFKRPVVLLRLEGFATLVAA